MPKPLRSIAIALSFAVAAAAAPLSTAAATTATTAATPSPSSAPSQAAHTVRVGGSPADAAYRDAQQKSGAEFRAARTACRNGPAGAGRNDCLKAARERLTEQRLQARTAHDAARR